MGVYVKEEVTFNQRRLQKSEKFERARKPEIKKADRRWMYPSGLMQDASAV